ncbi:hypothetical protein ABL78_1379 [Leptomonas seymouri]|uniref:Uncharacterized protein n=1 Tax=Leptomonas seymouri TaxID=5684 RepID=A0A0N1I2B3_LEPSE|nr:hypothetical protein ABL78_1379 [Leptomonas seymouri]|eukprot:KPI89503.1 hypothetical protein ABL78_1379 [Leptomonas seymouri]
MAQHIDAWDAYRFFCVSAPVTSASVENGLPLLEEDELQDRLGLVEEYLSAWDALQQGFLRSSTGVCRRERELLAADEAEERRFIEDDSADLPHAVFAEMLFDRSRQLLMLQEAEARQWVFQAYMISFSASLFNEYEALLRMRVTYEALDSLAIKACHVGRWGLREGRLARTSVPGHVYVPSQLEQTRLNSNGHWTSSLHNDTVSLLVKLEKEERLLLGAAWRDFMDSAMAGREACERRHATAHDSLTMTTDAAEVLAQ